MGAGGGLGAIAGGVGGFMIGGPAGAAIGAGLGGQLGNTIDSMSNRPQYSQPSLDAGTQGLMAQQEKKAINTSPEGYTSQYMSGTDKSGMLQDAANSTAGDQATRGGYGTNGMSSAIQAKAQRGYQNSMNKLQTGANIQGMSTFLQRNQDAASMATNLSNYQRGVSNQIDMYNTQAQAARYQLMGQLFGSMGTVGGLAMGAAKPGSALNAASGAQNIVPNGGVPGGNAWAGPDMVPMNTGYSIT